MSKICRLCGARNETDECQNSLCRGYKKTSPRAEEPIVAVLVPENQSAETDQSGSTTNGDQVTHDSQKSRRAALTRIATLQSDRMTQERLAPFPSDDISHERIAKEPRLTNNERLVRIARYQRWVMIALLMNFPGTVLSILAPMQPLAIAIPMLAASLAVAAYMIIAIYLLARHTFGVHIAVVAAAAMFIPCLSLIILVMVNQKATETLQQRGLYVGFFGVDPSSIRFG
jgi:hypothetical protein